MAKKDKWKKPKQDVWVRDLAGTNKKVDAFIKSQGGDEWDIAGFKNYMNLRTARSDMDSKAASSATNAFNEAHETSIQKQKEKAEKPKESKQKKKKKGTLLTELTVNKKKNGFLDSTKDFFTGKDTDGDGKPNGLFKALELIDRPGDAVRTGIKEKLEGRSFFDGAKDGFLGKKNTTGKDLNESLGFNPDKDKKDNVISRELGRQAINQLPLGKLVSPWLKNDHKQKIGKEVAGAGTEVALDPLNLIGTGIATKGPQAVDKGITTALRKLIPDDLPKFDGNVNPKLIDEITPKPKATLPPQKGIEVDPAFNVKRYKNPEQPLNELLGRQKQAESPLMQMAKKNMYEERPLPDFSNAKPIVEKPSNVNVYGAEVPKDLVNDAPPQYWQKRYEDFTKHVQSNYDTNRLTPEALEDLWSQYARYDEPVTLDQVVDLAYKGYKEPKVINTAEVWDKLGNRPPVSQSAKKILGLNGVEAPKPMSKPTPNVLETLPQLTQKRTIYKPSQQSNSVVNTNIPEQSLAPQITATNRPKLVPELPNERKFFNTLQNSEKTSPEMLERLENFDKTYKPMSNDELVTYANKYIEKDAEKAFQFVKNAKKFDPRHITVAHRLIDELQTAGNFERAVDVAERLAEQGTKAGQSVQAYSIYNRLTPQGQLVRAQRLINKINEVRSPKDQVKMTPQLAENLTATAETIQRITGQEDLGKGVHALLEKAKKGNMLSDDELKTVRSFMTDAKKFIGDLTVKEKSVLPKPVNPRNRDKIVDFMGKKEELARKRLKQTFGSRANSLPVDVFYDLSVIGASKIAKGTVKFADFSEIMVKEFGEQVRPYMQQIFDKAAETFNLQTDKMTTRRLTAAEKIVDKAITDKMLSVEHAEELLGLTKRLLNSSGDAKFEASMELQAALNALERPSFAQKISSAQTQAQLLNLVTMARNAIGNEVFYRIDRASKLLAVPFDMAQAKITGTQRTIVFNTGQFNWNGFFQPSKDYAQGFKTGIKAGWRGVNPLGLNTAYDIQSPAFRSKFNPLHWTEKILGASLRSFDTAGFMRAYNQTLREQATLKAMNEGLKGKELREAAERYFLNADENMQEIANQYGKYATFQDNTMLANALTKAKQGMNKISTLGMTKEFGLGDLILKYPKTPGNLIMRALDYSPAGVVRSIHFLNDFRKHKNPFDMRELQLSFARAIVGTGGFSAFGFMLADKGVLTSAGDSDYEVKELEKMAGKQPNSVNVTAIQRFLSSGLDMKALKVQEGDTFVSYDWAQPVSISMSLGTGVNQAFEENKNPTALDATKSALNSAGNTVVNMSVLSGLNNFLTGYQGETWSDKLEGSTKGAVGSFIPTLSNQARKFNDNTSRNAYSPLFTGELKNRAYNRIPGLDSKLPPAYDTLGNTREMHKNDSNNFFNVFMNPSFVSQYKPSPEAKFVLDYINATGDKKAAPKLADKKLDGIPLTGEQHSKMQRIMGEEVRKGIAEEMQYLDPNDYEAIAEVMEDILREAGKTAREAIRAERGE